MNINDYIKQWAYLCESEENKMILNESLTGDFTNKDIAESFSNMLRTYRHKLIRAVYVNDHNFISKDYTIDEEKVDFKLGDNIENEKTMRLEDMVKILIENPDKKFYVEGKKVIELDYDIEDSDGSILPCMITE